MATLALLSPLIQACERVAGNATDLAGPDADLVTLDRRMTITRLGQGVDASRRLAPEAIERTCAALREYRGAIDAGRTIAGLQVDVLELPGRTPLILIEVPAFHPEQHSAPADDTGHPVTLEALHRRRSFQSHLHGHWRDGRQ